MKQVDAKKNLNKHTDIMMRGKARGKSQDYLEFARLQLSSGSTETNTRIIAAGRKIKLANTPKKI